MALTLKDQLEELIAESEAREAASPGRHRGTDWFQLSDAEEDVFRIDYDRFPRMIDTWHCYEAFKRIVTENFSENLIEQARQQHPQWCGEGVGQNEFSEFAKEFGGLTYREAHAIYTKHDFWTVRLGVARYKDERGKG